MKPDQTGLSASVVAFAKVFFMFLIFPRILSLRPYLYRKFLHRERASEDGETTSSQFDVVVAFLSLLVEATAVSMFGFAKNPVQLVMLFAFQVLGSGNVPALQSIAVASVDRSESGLVLSGLQIVVSIAEVGSTIGMGAILSATIVTMPWVMFVVCGGMMTIAALLLLLVRDSDRWKED
ncbi:hypothetical protein FRC02_001862 [Tulasnella sp. 418]|nr:hypothetical protein FRC02_001862 [Tulasnella sp. 418]